MKFNDIMAALPKDVADKLQTKLDAIPFGDDLTRDEALELMEDAAKMTRLEIVIADDEKRRMVDTLLTFVAQAGVTAIFG